MVGGVSVANRKLQIIAPMSLSDVWRSDFILYLLIRRIISKLRQINEKKGRLICNKYDGNYSLGKYLPLMN